jgi:hypothetical protein
MAAVAPGGGMEGGAGVEATRKPGHNRTEFVVFFIWKEPTPSDDLMKPVEDTGPPSTGTGAGGAGGSGGMGGAGAAPSGGGGAGAKDGLGLP